MINRWLPESCQRHSGRVCGLRPYTHHCRVFGPFPPGEGKPGGILALPRGGNAERGNADHRECRAPGTPGMPPAVLRGSGAGPRCSRRPAPPGGARAPLPALRPRRLMREGRTDGLMDGLMDGCLSSPLRLFEGAGSRCRARCPHSFLTREPLYRVTPPSESHAGLPAALLLLLLRGQQHKKRAWETF